MPKPINKHRDSQISRHPERVAIEMARMAGVTLDRIAERFGVHRDAIARHMHALPASYKAALIADVPREELVRRALEESGSLLDHMKLARSLTEQQLIAAKACGDHMAVAALSKAVQSANEAVGRLTGDLQRMAPGITINNNVAVITDSPQFRVLESGLIAIARKHPDAKPEILQLVRSLKEMPSDAPLIEGERARAA